MRIVQGVVGWFVDRLGLAKVIRVFADHPVPPGTARGRSAWMYVLGAATLVAFMLQVVTGIALATKYVPAPEYAYRSLVYLTERVWLGGFLRAMHFWGASAMVVLIFAHTIRVYLTASYKFPREFNWLTGVALLLLTLAMAFTGQLLRWDADGVWGVFVASHYAARVPVVGEYLKEFVLGGSTIGGVTLTRAYAFHVVLMPLLIFGLIGLHLFLVLHHGVSEPPDPDRPADPSTYRESYGTLLDRHGRPYFPDAVWREAVAAFAVIAVVMLLALVVGPKGPGEPASPTMIPMEPKPDWYLLWYYGLLSVKPPRIETFTMVYLPLLLVGMMILLPLAFGRGARTLRRRPWAVVVVGVSLTAFGVLTELGSRAPWVMDFETRPLTAAEVGVSQGPVWEGAQLFHERGCQYCHVAAGRGGAYGPEMDGLLRRLPREVVTTRIVQGFGNMPGYRGILSSAELAAILTFLESLEDR